MKKEVSSIQSLIFNYFRSNKNNFIFSRKKGYRTFSINGKEFIEKVKKVRILFKKLNIKKGDKIIVVGINSIELIIVNFACILSGIVLIPLDVNIDRSLFKKIQKETDSKLIFQDKSLQKFSKSKTFYLDELDLLIKKIKSNSVPNIKIKPKDILEIVYTSGATGDPKGVILTNENIISAINYASNLIGMKEKKILNPLPLSHIFSQIYGLFLMMHWNNKIYFIDTIQPRKIISFIKMKKINGLIAVPGILNSLKNECENKSTLFSFGPQFRFIGVGGAMLDIELERWWRKRLYVLLQGYGLTETSSVVSTNKIGDSKLGSVGKIIQGVEIKIDEDGEILIRGKNVTSGYYKAKQKTSDSFKDGWFKTGDIGEIINDFLYLKERKKDIIITASGLNVYSTDIENVLNGINNVKESCVIEKDGEIHAVLILKKRTDMSSIINKANNKLLSHQKIKSYSIWHDENFPKTSLGKIKKFIVIQTLDKSPAKFLKYKDKFLNLINSVLKSDKKINYNSKLYDVGMDSLKRIELIIKIEKEFGVEMNEADLNQYTRVKQLENLIKRPSKKINFSSWPLNPLIHVLRYLAQHFLFYPLIKIFIRTNYSGLENLKKFKGPVIFVSNHQSAWDVPVLVNKLGPKIAVPAHPKVIFGLDAKGTIFYKIYRKLIGYFTTFFYNTYIFGEEIGTDKSLEFTGELIDKNYSILIFPEGMRTRDGKIHDFKLGIGYSALEMKVPIIPIKIDGLFEVLPIGKAIPRFHKAKVKIGEPIPFDKINNLSYLRATKFIEKKVKEL